MRANQVTPGAQISLTAAEFVRLRDLLAAYCGLFLDPAQQRAIESAVARRMQQVAASFPVYEQRLRGEHDELRQLAELVVNHETYFMRNQPHIRALQQVLLPELHRRKPLGEPLRIWSAGCSTGEEAYSLAITALDALPLANRPIEVWATDLSEAALELARAGVYAGRALAQVAPETLDRHFVPHGNGYQVNPRVRALVRFEQRNLLEPLPAQVALTDIVFCQNVLIYFKPATSLELLRHLFEQLPTGALLFLGFAETLWPMFSAFHTREVNGAYVYYKEAFSAATTKLADDQRAPAVPIRHMSKPKARERQPSILPIAEGPGLSDAAMVIAQARLYADRGQIDQAIAEVERALTLDPMHSEAALLLGLLHGGQGRWEAATAQFERARYLNPLAPLISFHLAEALRQHSRIAYALREYRSALWKLDPHPPDTVLDGVTIGWLRETCQRQITQLSQQQGER